MSNKPMLAWHFLRSDRCLGYNDGRKVQAGKIYRVKGELIRCENGMHGSRRIIDALSKAPGPIACRVDMIGEIIHYRDESVARARRMLWSVDATNILHEFACRCAEDALAFIDKPDERSVNAIYVKRLWMAGKATDSELAAARSAARAAAWWDAADSDAADSDAAGEAAWDDAWDDARIKQNRRLTAMVCAAHESSNGGGA